MKLIRGIRGWKTSQRAFGNYQAKSITLLEKRFSVNTDVLDRQEEQANVPFVESKPSKSKPHCFDQMFDVLAQTSAPVDPSNRSFDNPAAWLNSAANLAARRRDNLQGTAELPRCPFLQLTTIPLPKHA